MAIMDENESLARLNAGPLTALVREDLDPYSVEELEARIETLESEIARARSAMDRKKIAGPPPTLYSLLRIINDN